MLPGAGKTEEMDPLSPGSHHPVSISADEELPYLQVFTPLLFTSTITAIQPEVETGQEPVLQRHAISVASSPPGLFVATIDMTVNTKTLSIAELVVPRLDPSAISELGPFLEEVLRGGGNSALTRNVGVVTWAMGEWVRKATRRARFWHAVTSELGNAEQLFQCAKAMRQKTRRKRDRGQYDEDGEEYTDGGPDKAHPSKADIVSLMGRTCLDLDLSGVAGNDDNEALIARIQWRVEFDWTGEARNKIGLLLRAPVRWHASDDKGSLAWLPDMFDKLLRDQKDPLEAVKTIVSLMIADGQP
ncbi:hypothetical protein NUW58_g6670 [Xylaria curta]|uniref:Uncharacterized protein n=1 Tax=Xylaria curta TaxID=42375 RepID=A0ACC1NQC2_9PEZI|nr:hypothetical protein NUW58_g6670 [Xylaria curta]